MAVLLPVAAGAQSNWERPDAGKKSEPVKEERRTERAEEGAAEPADKYLASGAVPVKDGKVAWTADFDVPGTSAQENYDRMLVFLSDFVKEDGQLEDSNVSLVNRAEHKIAVSVRQWLVFNSSFFAIDRAEFHYTLLAECYDNCVKITMSRISYLYEEQPKTRTVFKAEELITDEQAMNKTRTKLVRPGSRFRRKTIDCKDELMGRIASYLHGEGSASK